MGGHRRGNGARNSPFSAHVAIVLAAMKTRAKA
jgi:hypothetical protein